MHQARMTARPFGPRWRRDGKELLYLTPDGAMMSIVIDATGEFRPSAAKRLFTVSSAIPEWGMPRRHRPARFSTYFQIE